MSVDKFRPKFYYTKSTTKPGVTRPAPQPCALKPIAEPEAPDGSRLSWWSKLRRVSDEPAISDNRAAKRAQWRQEQAQAQPRQFYVGQTLARQMEPSERDRLKQLRSRRKKIVRLLRYSLFGLIILTGLVRFLVFRVEVQVAQFARQPDLKPYQATIEAYLVERPFERLSFNIDQKHLERFLQTKHPEIHELTDVTSGFLQPTQFRLTLRQAVATMLVNQQRYFVDAAGVPFVNNYQPAPPLEIADQSGIKQSGQLNQRLISGRFLRFIGRAIALTSEKGYQITTATIPTGTVHQIEFKVRGVEPYVKMTIDRDVAEQVEDLARSLAHIKRSGLKAQYLDVRVANKVFYK